MRGFRATSVAAAVALSVVMAACTTPAVGGGGGGGTTTTAGPTTSTTTTSTTTTTTTLPPGGPSYTVIDLDCNSSAAGQNQQTDVAQGATVDAPGSVTAGNNFVVDYDADDLLVPAEAGGYTITQMGQWELKFPVPANATFVSATLVGGGGYTATPTVALNGSVVHFKLLDWVPPLTTIDFPNVVVTYQATGSAGSLVEPTMFGTSYGNWGLKFKNTVTVFGFPVTATSTCFPTAPSPVLNTTAII